MKYNIYYNCGWFCECNTDEDVISYMRERIAEDRRIIIDHIIGELERIRYYADESITYYEQAELKQDIEQLDDRRLYGEYTIKDTDSGETISAYDFMREGGVI